MTSKTLIVALLGAGLLPAQTGWKAGAAKIAITPREPIWLAGYGGRIRPSDGVLQDIYVKALALHCSEARPMSKLLSRVGTRALRFIHWLRFGAELRRME